MNETKKQENRGGKRPGSGQPKKDTKILYRRVPAKHFEFLKKEMDELIRVCKSTI